jgi:hypothetical protein
MTALLHRCVPAAAFALALMSAAPLALAQPAASRSQWLPPGADLGALAETRALTPPEILARVRRGDDRLLFGEVLFRSPALMGETARRAGISCESCHPAGQAARQFFVPGYSGRPGEIDLTSDLFDGRLDDGIFNPLPIPSLRGAASKRRLGRAERVASLEDFIRHVVVDELAGDPPEPPRMDALVAYLRALPEMDEAHAVLGELHLRDDVLRIDRFIAFATRLLGGERTADASLVIAQARRELGDMFEHYPASDANQRARGVLAAWSRALADAAGAVERGEREAALRALATLRAQSGELVVLGYALPTSLYDPAMRARAAAR